MAPSIIHFIKERILERTESREEIRGIIKAFKVDIPMRPLGLHHKKSSNLCQTKDSFWKMYSWCNRDFFRSSFLHIHGTKIRGVYVRCSYYFYVLCVNSEELGTWILGFVGATAINLAMDLSKLNNKFWLRLIIFHNMYNATLNTKYLKK